MCKPPYTACINLGIYGGSAGTPGKELRQTYLGSQFQQRRLNFYGIACSPKCTGGYATEKFRHAVRRPLAVWSQANALVFIVHIRQHSISTDFLKRFGGSLASSRTLHTKWYQRHCDEDLLEKRGVLHICVTMRRIHQKGNIMFSKH